MVFLGVFKFWVFVEEKRVVGFFTGFDDNVFVFFFKSFLFLFLIVVHDERVFFFPDFLLTTEVECCCCLSTLVNDDVTPAEPVATELLLLLLMWFWASPFVLLLPRWWNRPKRRRGLTAVSIIGPLELELTTFIIKFWETSADAEEAAADALDPFDLPWASLRLLRRRDRDAV